MSDDNLTLVGELAEHLAGLCFRATLITGRIKNNQINESMVKLIINKDNINEAIKCLTDLKELL